MGMRFSALFLLGFLSVTSLFGQVTNIGSEGISNGSSPLTISNQIQLTANQTWSTVGPFNVTGYIDGNNKDLTLNGAGNIVISNQINQVKDLKLMGSGNRVLDVISNTNTVTVSSTGTNTFNGTINSKKLTVTSGINTFNGTINVQNQGITTSGTTNTTFNGEINAGSNGITINGSGNIVFNGQIHNAGSLNINGGGNVTLSGNGQNNIGNTYVNDGTLIMDQTNGIAISGGLTVGSDGIVQFEGNSQTPSWQNVTLEEGATLYLGDTNQSFSNLIIEGDSVIDFGSGGSTLNIGSITVLNDAVLTIANWNTVVDYFTASSNPNNAVVQIYYADTGQSATWTSGGGFIKPGQPVPEPSTYGLIMVGSMVGLVFFRRSYYNKR